MTAPAPDDAERLLTDSAAVLTVFDCDTAYLCELRTGLELLGSQYLGCAKYLGRLAKTLMDYSLALSAQSKAANAQVLPYLNALRETFGRLEAATQMLSHGVGQMGNSVGGFLDNDSERLERAKRDLGAIRARLSPAPEARAAAHQLRKQSRAETGGKGQSPPAEGGRTATPPLSAATLGPLIQEARTSMTSLCEFSVKARKQVITIADKSLPLYWQHFAVGAEAVKLLDVKGAGAKALEMPPPEDVPQQQGQQAQQGQGQQQQQQQLQRQRSPTPPSGTPQPSLSLPLKETGILGLPRALKEMIDMERTQLTRMNALMVLKKRIQQNMTELGFDTEDEVKVVSGPVEKALQLHIHLISQLERVEIAGRQNPAVVIAELYDTQLKTAEEVLIAMVQESGKACFILESPRMKSLFKNQAEKNDYFALRLSPLDYFQSLERKLQDVQSVLPQSDPGYARLETVKACVEKLVEIGEYAREESDNAAYLVEIKRTIEGFDDLEKDNRRLLGETDVSVVKCKTTTTGVTVQSTTTRHHLYLFSDVLAITDSSIALRSRTVQVLVAKGPMASLQINPGTACPSTPHPSDAHAGSAPHELLICWVRDKKAGEQIKLGFRSETERVEWEAKMRKAAEAAEAMRVYGVDLDALYARVKKVPPFLSYALGHIVTNGLDSEGLFRLSGGVSRVNKLLEEIDCGRLPQFSCVTEATDVVRAWLRMLPVPLLGPPAALPAWVALGEKAVAKTLAPADVRAVVAKLTRGQYSVCAVLFKTLQKVHEHSAKNMMTAKNLAVVFTPTILPVAGNAMPTQAYFAVVEELIVPSVVGNALASATGADAALVTMKSWGV
eukprot:m51a1_g3092 putative -domain-containing protein (840) ;mRNA; r:91181-94926